MVCGYSHRGGIWQSYWSLPPFTILPPLQKSGEGGLYCGQAYDRVVVLTGVIPYSSSVTLIQSFGTEHGVEKSFTSPVIGLRARVITWAHMIGGSCFTGVLMATVTRRISASMREGLSLLCQP